MRVTTWIATLSLLATALVAGTAVAHESYEIGDGDFTITVGDQNEPMYTWKWSNLDLIIRDADGDPVPGAHETLNGTLVAPGGEELNGTLEGQFGQEGRYEFEEGYFYTQPGQYTLELEGDINGTDASGSYDLPGPRQSMRSFAFPHEEVPTVLDLDERITALEDQGDESIDAQRVDQLEQRVQQLEQRLEEREAATEETADAPGVGAGLAVGAIGAVALTALRRER